MNVLPALSRTLCSAGSRSRLFAALVVLSAIIITGQAQATDDPPGRVGRLAKTSGQVWMYDAERQDWMETAVNQPLTSGDRLSIGSDARAVVQIGSTTVRIDNASELEFQRIDDSKVALQLHNGSIGVQVVSPEVVSEIEFFTGEAYFFPRRTGHYRIDRRDGVTQAGVWNGELSAAGPGLNQTISRGQRLELWQQGASTRLAWHTTESDDFSDWVVRSQDESARSVTRNYVSPEMTGWEDLDRHGRWETNDEYGAIWYPSVSVEWAPFRYGRWTWVRPWGWTWIDSAPWGFAPFHYGRWIQVGGRWCWSPGTRMGRPVYAPAMVTWPGSVGTNISVRIGNGPPAGWIPLSPYDSYRPYYRSTPNYTTVINQTHVHIRRAPDRDRDGKPDWRDNDRNNDRGRDRDRNGRRDGYDHPSQYRNAPVVEAVSKPDDRYGNRSRPPQHNEQRGSPRPEWNSGSVSEGTTQRPNGRNEWNRPGDDNERQAVPRERHDSRDSNDGNRRGNAPASPPVSLPARQPAMPTPPPSTPTITPQPAPPAYTPSGRHPQDVPNAREAERDTQPSRYETMRMQRPDTSRDDTQERRGSGRERIEQRYESPRAAAPVMERAVSQPAAAPSRSAAPVAAPAPPPAPRAENRRKDDDDDRRDHKRGRNDRENER